jgi:Tfp pilus assembly protein FimT
MLHEKPILRVSALNETPSPADVARSEESSDRGMRGFSIIELLIVCGMIFVLSGFALTQITRASNSITRTNVAHEMTIHMEKARLDSIRRHAVSVAQMARLTLINSTSYSVTYDVNGDGVLDSARVITIPANSSLTFGGTFPRTIRFNWRGNTVNSAGNSATPSDITLSNSYGSSTINVTSAGQSAFDVTTTSDAVVNSSAPVAKFRDQTQLP